MADTKEILDRIDKVLRDNKRTENIYLFLTVLLFLSGIACIITALVTGELVWSTPSAVTTGFLYFPLKEIKVLRNKNVALATAPIIITQLPPDKAAEEIQKLLEHIYGGENGR
ncbi:hypothetical protein [Echinicola vietnamensis]|uniref:Uncharacterized protein n=1 Tax=Echinicola vietnamensis (strain DSM 17526 / LMG 23754 / KMM 6221) TaxID=926556 RepID=L0G004_ECHVK|nr:hypothetical protein [Echinicola vietnamensis]AGA78887.1 hypothetical protein Echvi_2646 [Echinicola vietnamensis DSM 17526]